MCDAKPASTLISMQCCGKSDGFISDGWSLLLCASTPFRSPLLPWGCCMCLCFWMFCLFCVCWCSLCLGWLSTLLFLCGCGLHLMHCCMFHLFCFLGMRVIAHLAVSLYCDLHFQMGLLPVFMFVRLRGFFSWGRLYIWLFPFHCDLHTHTTETKTLATV